MAKYELLIRTSAAREIRRIRDKKLKRRIVARIEGLAEEPRPPGCQKLAGSQAYRIRIGAYRVVYEIEDDVLVISNVRVAHRREVYR